MEDDFQGPYLNPEELGLMLAAWDKELALLNAVLEIEVEQREREFATLEGCSFCGQFEEGQLDNRI